MKILHGPVNIGNQPWMLSRTEREMGFKSDVVVNYNTWLQYPNDRSLSAYQDKSCQARSRRALFALLAPFKYDILHYYFGRSFACWDDYGQRTSFWFGDLKLAKKLGRRIIMTLQGCDCRLYYRSSAINSVSVCGKEFCRDGAYCSSYLDKEKMFLIENIVPLADKTFVLNPELCRYVPGSVFLPYTSVDVENISPVWPKGEGPIKILHAPSDPYVKGTRFIVDAVQKLQARYPIELVTVKGLPHNEAVRLYQQADIVIDQVSAGWYGAFAVETMALGKPVLCYLREEDFQFIPQSMLNDMPIRNINVSSLETDIEQVILQRTKWQEWAEKSRQFVLRWHNPRHIAKAMLEIYRNPSAPFTIYGKE